MIDRSVRVHNLEARHFGLVVPRVEQADEVRVLMQSNSAWVAAVDASEHGFAFEHQSNIICIGGICEMWGARHGWAIVSKDAPKSALFKILQFAANFLKADNGKPIHASTKTDFYPAAKTLVRLGFRPDKIVEAQDGYCGWVYGAQS